MKRNALILISGILLAMTASLVSAAPPAAVTITSPKNGAIISGGDVEISVAFSSRSAQPVTRVQINLDGKSVTERAYDSGQAAGECGFLWDTVRTEDGQHRLDVQIYSGKTFLGMTTSVVRVANKTRPAEIKMPTEPAADIKPPQVKITSPAEGQSVSGRVPVAIQAKDDSGKSPYVSVFIDKSLKAVTNHEPYSYTWDSSQAENGPHEIHVSAIDDAENRTVTSPVRIIVRNPEKVNTVVTSSVPVETTSVAPAENREAATESARTATAAVEAFESPAAPIPVVRAGVVLAPLAVETRPVLVGGNPEPEVAVLVSGPTEFIASAAPRLVSAAPVPKPVEIAAARIDQPKKPVTTPRPAEKVFRVYTVQPGEALWTIARRFDTSVEALVEANEIEDPSLIKMGRTLRIPVQSGSVMVSLRSALDGVGGTLGWDAKKQSAHGWAPGIDVRVRIGSARAQVNDRQVVMEKAAALKSGRTMVPQSFVTDTLGKAPVAGK